MRLLALVSLVTWQLSGCTPAAPQPVTPPPTAPAPAPVRAPPAHQPSLQERAGALFNALGKRDFRLATADFDENLKRALTPSKFAEVWQQAEQQHGLFQGAEVPALEKGTRPETILVRLNFQHGELLARVVFRPDRRIAGLAFEQVYDPPDYADPEAFVERDLVVGAAEWQLPATLTLPKSDAPVPGVVLVHGSGPQDRDETVGPNKTFKDLAWGLASRGIAVLRYDKRTLVHRRKLEPVPEDFTVNAETVDDAVAALDTLRKQPEVAPDGIYLLGHSLGGQMAPRIATRDGGVAGLIILAGSARPMYESILEQADYLGSLSEHLSPPQRAQLAFMKAEAKRLETLYRTGKTEAGSILGTPRAYWLDLKDYDAPALAAKIGKRVLVLQGGRDYQVTSADFELWQKALGNEKRARLTRYDELDHLFIRGEGKSQPGDYQRPGHVDRAVIEDIAKFIKP